MAASLYRRAGATPDRRRRRSGCRCSAAWPTMSRRGCRTHQIASRRAQRRRPGRRAAAGATGRHAAPALPARARLMNERGRQMATEFREAPEVVRRQAQALAAPVAELAARLKRRPPDVVVTCARGSSAHAATFGKHLFERHLGIVLCAGGAQHRQRLSQRDAAEGPALPVDLAIRPQRRSRRIRAHGQGRGRHQRRAWSTIPHQPAGGGVRHRAADRGRTGAQRRGDQDLRGLARRVVAADGSLDGRCRFRHRLERLPDRLAAASELDWSAALGALTRSQQPGDLGRGPTLAIAREAALKFKETCDLHGRGLQRRGIPAWPGVAGGHALSGADVHADRCGGQGHCRNSPPTCAAKARRSSSPARTTAARACRPSSRRRRDLSHSEPVCIIGSGWRSAAAPISTSRGICGKSRARDEHDDAGCGGGPASSTAWPCNGKRRC